MSFRKYPLIYRLGNEQIELIHQVSSDDEDESFSESDEKSHHPSEGATFNSTPLTERLECPIDANLYVRMVPRWPES